MPSTYTNSTWSQPQLFHFLTRIHPLFFWGGGWHLASSMDCWKTLYRAQGSTDYSLKEGHTAGAQWAFWNFFAGFCLCVRLKIRFIFRHEPQSTWLFIWFVTYICIYIYICIFMYLYIDIPGCSTRISQSTHLLFQSKRKFNKRWGKITKSSNQ